MSDEEFVEPAEYKHLNFTLTQPIWLEFDEGEGEVLGWTTKKPRADNGYISKNTILIYDHIYLSTPTDQEPGLNFIEIHSGDTAEFIMSEVKEFVDSGVFEIIKSIDVDNVVLTPNSIVADSSTILITDNISVAGIYIGNVVPLQDLIECYINHRDDEPR